MFEIKFPTKHVFRFFFQILRITKTAFYKFIYQMTLVTKKGYRLVS